MSIKQGKGGSCAHFSPLMGWSNPYPETTGYAIPTLLNVSSIMPTLNTEEAAFYVGDWLLSIQKSEGSWLGGLYPNKTSNTGSVFNTGQILKGMMALYHHSGEQKYLDAAVKGSEWLANGVDAQGLWPANDYKAKQTPSYYTHVAWPMLEVWKESQNEEVRESAERFLMTILSRRKNNGAFSGWEFEQGKPAFTHTISYTIRGFQECARLLDEVDKYSIPTKQALEFLLRKAEFTNGKLPGAFDIDWKGNRHFVCLTGNAQIAINLLILESYETDLRIVNAAAKLVDFVCSVQRNANLLDGVHGGVAGSYPLWGKYMVFRYPNWAAKYHCDALLLLIKRITNERECSAS
ncbi:MAG: hypothetical protein HAW67_05100 [Endozoicomonadaceae bacterium]|nr:hypothetical protein [Endozoicomonadaceae bacterium]